MTAERDVLSCWISELRSCSPDSSEHAWCYNQKNAAQLWQKWVTDSGCTEGLLASTRAPGRLTVLSFGFLLL